MKYLLILRSCSYGLLVFTLLIGIYDGFVSAQAHRSSIQRSEFQKEQNQLKNPYSPSFSNSMEESNIIWKDYDKENFSITG